MAHDVKLVFSHISTIDPFLLPSARGLSENYSESTFRFPQAFKPSNQHLSQLMRLWYLSHISRPAKAQASLRIRAVSPEPSLSANMKYGSRRRVHTQIRHLAPLDGYACAIEGIYGG